MKCSSVTIKALVLFLLIIFFFSCGGKVTTRPDDDEHEFTINGVVVKDMNSGKDIAYFSILRDGDPFDGAVVKVGSDTLENEGNGNYFLDGFPLFNYGQNVSINISSAADDFSLSTSRQMPGSFEITSINPDPVRSGNTEDVKVHCNSSAGASGYLINIIRPDGSNGYAGLVSLGDMITIGASIPRDAFEEGGAFVEGTYQVYVVAYDGSFVYYPGMEFDLPAGLPSGNLSGANGTVGAGVLAASASIEAVLGK
ncbi:MAG: hypothetical protein WBC77_06225 [Candidatus Zixiibacteriota bacterium]